MSTARRKRSPRRPLSISQRNTLKFSSPHSIVRNITITHDFFPSSLTNIFVAALIFGPPDHVSSLSDGALGTSVDSIYHLFKEKTNDKHRNIPGDGIPQFVDVRDVAKAHVFALTQDSVVGKRILLSGGPCTNYEVCLS